MYNRVFKHPMLFKHWPNISLILSTKFHEKNLFFAEKCTPKLANQVHPDPVHGTSTTIIHTLNLILIQPNMSNLLHVFTYEIAWQSRDCFTLCSSRGVTFHNHMLSHVTYLHPAKHLTILSLVIRYSKVKLSNGTKKKNNPIFNAS